MTPIPARFLVTVGLVLATLGGSLAALDATVLDRGRLVAHADQVLETDRVHAALAARLANTLAPPDPDPPADEIGQPNPALPLAERAVTEPEFERAFASTLGAVHANVVDGSDRPLTLDPRLVGEAVVSARGGGPLVLVPMELDADLFPDAHRSLELVELASGLLVLLGFGLLAAGLATSRKRARTVMRIGRWAIAVGVVGALWFWALPGALLIPLGGWPAVGGIVISTGDWLALPALGLALLGALLVGGGHLWEQRTRSRTLAVIPRHQGRETGWAGPV